MNFTRYMPEILQFANNTEAKAVYCFVIDGNRGSGGGPVIMTPNSDAQEYRKRCEELIAMLKRSAELFQKDIDRHTPEKGGA